MATNPATYYGVELACVSDADELFSEVVGIGVVRQDAIHRLTVESVLGPNGDDWGYDCRKLLGMKSDELVRMQPTIIEVLTRDDRIETADVTLESVINPNGMHDVKITVQCETALGPFEFTRFVSELTLEYLENLT
jgi:hypothetical protein